MAEIDLRKTGFSGRIIGPTAPDFTESSYRYSAIAERKARYIAYPKSAEDVSIAIIFASQSVFIGSREANEQISPNSFSEQN